MKFIKAAGPECISLCPCNQRSYWNRRTLQSVCRTLCRTKAFFNSYPEAFSRFLEKNQQSNYDAKFKARLRERAYWVYNRRTLSDEDIQRLSFIQCLMEMK